MMTGFDRLTEQLVDAVKARVAGDRHRLPEAGTILWNAFCDLAAARTYGMGGPDPIPYSEIAAWSRLFRCPLEPHHVRALRAMDDAWLAAAEAKKPGGEPAPSADLSPGLFDALFQKR